MLDIESMLLGMAAGGGGGSGNPNYVETVNGTIANPWGDADYAELINGITSNALTVAMVVQSIQLIAAINNGIVFSLAIFDQPSDSAPYVGASVIYPATDGGALTIAKANFGTGSWVNLPSATPCVLYIIHHPLP